MVFILILILSYLLQLFLPWWIIVVISFAACGLIGKTAKISFWSPFFAILLLWIGMALYKSIPNENLLAGKIAVMFGLSAWWHILIVTGLIGGIAAGISGLCGYLFRKAILYKKTEN